MVLYNKAILIVDDESVIREMISDELQGVGAKVFFAQDGKQALELIHEENIDLIVTDVKMPVMTGVEFIKEFEDRKLNIPIVVMTGYSDYRDFLDNRESISKIFIKPFNMQDLVDEIENLIKEGESPLEAQKTG